MRLLLDANCLVEIARNRAHADVMQRVLAEVPHEQIKISDYAVHSIAIVRQRFGSLSIFPALIDDIGVGRTIAVVRLFPPDWPRVVEVASAYRLDVADAYQYVAAELDRRRVVSLDADFDRTPNGRLKPARALQMFQDETNR